MARCGCASDRCSCNFIAGENIIISGAGSRSNPYVIQAVAQDGGGTGGGTAPARLTGEIIAYGGANAPSGWLLCNGALVDRGAFPDLYAVLGTAFGAGDGMTTFGLPDLNGRFPVGVNSTYTRGKKGGASTVVLTDANMPDHTHTMYHTHTATVDIPTLTTSEDTHNHEVNVRESASGLGPQIYMGTTTGTQGTISTRTTTGDTHSHVVDIPPVGITTAGANNGTTSSYGSSSPTAVETMPPYTAVTYIIKT